ncbi:MAG: hypothetical protein ACFFCS_06580 [Candidatus Hodarchaeota archaeon]
MIGKIFQYDNLPIPDPTFYSLISGLIVVLIAASGGIIFFYEMRKEQVLEVRRMMRAWGILAVSVSLTYVFFNIENIIWFNSEGLGVMNLTSTLHVIAYVMIYIGFSLFLSSLELHVFNRRRVFAWIALVAVILYSIISVFIPTMNFDLLIELWPIFVIIYYIITGFLVLSTFGILAAMIKRTAGDLRRRFGFTVAGFSIFLIGVLFNMVLPNWGFILTGIICPALLLLGLIIILASRPTRLSGPLLDYYTSERLCIVHRGKIEDKVFACPSCGIFYCLRCQKALVEAGDPCWNCKASLETGKAKVIPDYQEDLLKDDLGKGKKLK